MPRAGRRNLLLRYEKERRKNLLAQPGVHPFQLVLDHIKPSYNVGKIFRSAEVFGSAGVHLIEVGPFDPAPAKGSFRKVPASFHEQFSSCYDQLESAGYQLFHLAVDGKETLGSAVFPQKSAFILGHEEFGCSFDPAAYPQIRSLRIPQLGSVQSLNVSIAAALVMYEYVRQRQEAQAP